MPIDDEGLGRYCGRELPSQGPGRHADEIIQWMGEPLARAWLRAHVIEAAEARRAALYGQSLPVQGALPQRDATFGRCRLLLVTKGSEQLPLLRPALVLPVDWRRADVAGEPSPRLPRGLAAFADDVLADLDLAGRLTLHLTAEYEDAGIDLSSLGVSFDSAWASLAAGALVAIEGGTTVPDVMATAAWTRAAGSARRGWITDVEGVPAKLHAAREAGARVVFVPRANRAAVEMWRRGGGEGIEVRELSNEETTARQAIRGLLEALEVRPTRAAGDTFDRRCAYHARIGRSADADRYYRAEILDEVCERVRGALPPDPRLAEVKKMAFVASASFAVPCLLAKLFDPGQVLVLHDGRLGPDVLTDLVTALAGLERSVCSSDRVVRVAACDPSALSESVATEIAAFEREFPQGRLLVDLTPGYRAFNLALLAAAPADGVRAFVHSPQAFVSGMSRARAGAEVFRLFDLPGIA